MWMLELDPSLMPNDLLRLLNACQNSWCEATLESFIASCLLEAARRTSATMSAFSIKHAKSSLPKPEFINACWEAFYTSADAQMYASSASQHEPLNAAQLRVDYKKMLAEE